MSIPTAILDPELPFKIGPMNGTLIPRLVDQDPWAQLRRPMDMIRQG